MERNLCAEFLCKNGGERIGDMDFQLVAKQYTFCYNDNIANQEKFMAKRNEFIERISKLFGRNSGKKYEEVSDSKITGDSGEQQIFNSNNEEIPF